MIQIHQSALSPLKINEVAQLCLLGVLSTGEQKATIALDKVLDLDTDKWQPTRDVLLFAMEREIIAGHIKYEKTARHAIVKLSEIGKRLYASMLKRPLPNESSCQAIFLALKACLVETAPHEVRSEVAQDLICYYHCRLSGLQNNCENCPSGNGRKQMKNDHNMRHIEEELEWLNVVMTSSANVDKVIPTTVLT